MTILEAIILGIIQGLTEFLPISSTGHLTLAGKFMSLISAEHPERWTAFIAVIQLGTLAAVFVYFWKDIYTIVVSFVKENILSLNKLSEQTSESKLGWLIIVGSIPVVIIGLGFKDVIEGAFTKNLYVIGGSLIGLALILALSEKLGKFKKDIKDLNWRDAVIVGIAQCFALIPGSSRSGTTITGGLFIGMKRDSAARFSFLLGIPAILGSGLLQFYKSLEYINTDGMLLIAVATISSAISGYFAIDFLLKFLKRNSTFVFIFYRIAIGLLILGLLNQGIVAP